MLICFPSGCIAPVFTTEYVFVQSMTVKNGSHNSFNVPDIFLFTLEVIDLAEYSP